MPSAPTTSGAVWPPTTSDSGKNVPNGVRVPGKESAVGEDAEIGRAVESPPLDPVLDGDRGRDVAEGRRVGERLGDEVGAELGREGEIVGVEVEEGLRATGGERAELDEGPVQSSGRCGTGPDRRRR